MLEIQQGAKSKNEFEVLRNAPFSIVSVTIDPRVSSWDLGVGESQVISYSLAHKKCRPILDDAEAKNCCFSNGLTPLGTGTILILAKNAGLVPAIRPILNDMRENGYWIAPAVIDMLCKKVSE
jgi:predicted nucleic acid-binding protein